MMRKMYAVLAAGAAMAACSLGNETPEEIAARMRELETRAVDLIGEAPCASVDECRFIGFGAKACGGPTRYLVYSVSFTDSTALQQVVEEHRELNRRYNRMTGTVSTCDVTPEPVLGKVGGRCVDLGSAPGPVE